MSSHSFPTDVVVSKKWFYAIRHDEGKHLKLHAIYSQHFKEISVPQNVSDKLRKASSV